MREQGSAERWLDAHESEVVGIGRRDAIDVVRRAGLLPRVIRHDAPPQPLPYRQGRVRLFIRHDETVRAVMHG